MAVATPISIWEIVTDFLASNPSPQEIIAYKLPPELEARAHDLLDRNGEGELSPVEVQEMQEFMKFDEIMSLLKAKTRLKLRAEQE